MIIKQYKIQKTSLFLLLMSSLQVCKERINKSTTQLLEQAIQTKIKVFEKQNFNQNIKQKSCSFKRKGKCEQSNNDLRVPICNAGFAKRTIMTQKIMISKVYNNNQALFH